MLEAGESKTSVASRLGLSTAYLKRHIDGAAGVTEKSIGTVLGTRERRSFSSNLGTRLRISFRSGSRIRLLDFGQFSAFRGCEPGAFVTVDLVPANLAGASFTDFGGWQMPLKYSSELAEHHAVRNAAGLFDLSHMGEVWVTGPDAAAFLDYALAGKLSAVAVGRAKYSLICQKDGGIIDDLISYRRAEQTYLVVPNAGNAGVVVSELAQRAADFNVTVEDVSTVTSLIAVQGPNAEAILLSLVPARQHPLVTELKYYAAVEVEINGHDLLLARTGYTGEDGFEIYVPNEDAPALWEALLENGAGQGLIPAGLACRDSLRLEAGMPLYGNELSRDGNPYAAGLGPVVSLAKESDFVGKAVLGELKALGAGSTAGRKLVGLKGLGRRAGRSHYPVLKDGTVVGEVTSGQPSPTLGYPIAMAYVDVEHSEPGTRLDIDLRGKAEPFEVVALPFYKRDK